MKKLLLLFLLLPGVVFGQHGVESVFNAIKGNGDLKYEFIHCVGSADSISESLGGTQYIYYKINTGGAMTWREADGMTCADDSVALLTAGDYVIFATLAATTSNVNDRIRCKLYTNNAPNPVTIGRFIINSNGAGLADDHTYYWYRPFSVNDVISWRVANNTGARAITIQDFKIFIYKLPE